MFLDPIQRAKTEHGGSYLEPLNESPSHHLRPDSKQLLRVTKGLRPQKRSGARVQVAHQFPQLNSALEKVQAVAPQQQIRLDETYGCHMNSIPPDANADLYLTSEECIASDITTSSVF